MREVTDLHVKLDSEDVEKLKKFCLHRGDLTFLISQAVKRYAKKLEEQQEREDQKLIYEVNVA